MRILPVLLLLCALFVVQSTLSKTPAFNPALRSESVLGDWRLVLNTSLYDPGEYEFQRGFGYIEAGSLFSDAVNADAETEALIDILSTRSDQALASLETAVTSDPANAHAWAALALTHLRRADDQEALGALRTSWKIAPHNRSLADTRTNVVSLLTDPEISSVTLSGEDYSAAFTDAVLLAGRESRAIEYYKETAPHMTSMLEKATSEVKRTK